MGSDGDCEGSKAPFLLPVPCSWALGLGVCREVTQTCRGGMCVCPFLHCPSHHPLSQPRLL